MGIIIKQSILSGILVGIGIVINTQTSNQYVGAMLFSIALLVIIKCELKLYTGKIGYFGVVPIKDLITMLIGNLIGVKPILISDVNGTQIAYKKVKGRSAAIKECVALMKESIVNAENQTVYLWSADCDSDEIEQLKELIKSEIPCKDVEVGIIGPIIGASIGPGALGIWCFGKDVTYKAE